MSSAEKIKVLSLYSGCGGLDYGFHKNESFEHVFANDFSDDAAKSYKSNFPESDQYFKVGRIEDYIGDIVKKDFDLLIGGFPCPAWSLAGKRNGFDDSRGGEFFTCLTVLHLKKPKAFVFENVPGLLSHDGRKTIKFMMRAIGNLGYRTYHNQFSMHAYGIPTTRERVIIVGTLDHEFDPAALIPLPSYKPAPTLGALLKDLGPPGEHLTDHEVHAPPVKLHWIKILKEGENLKDLDPSEVNRRQLDQFPNQEPRKIPSSIMGYKRLNSKTVAPTMAFGNTCLPIHPTEDRSISVREAASIQGFPKEFIFCGGISSKYKQIGNAVPPMFSELLANQIASQWKYIKVFKPQL